MLFMVIFSFNGCAGICIKMIITSEFQNKNCLTLLCHYIQSKDVNVQIYWYQQCLQSL